MFRSDSRTQSSDVSSQLFASQKPGKKRKRGIVMDSLGQSSDVFRLLVAAILGLAVLLIVLGIITIIEQQKFQLSELRFYDGFGHAVNLPTNEIFREEKLAFKGGDMFAAESLAMQFKIKEECIKFESPSNSQIKVFSTPHRVEMLNQLQTDVFFRCCYANGSDCVPVPPPTCFSGDLYCEVWFAERPA